MLRNAKGLYFGGGDQQLIADAYAGTKLYDEFIALLNRGGVIMGTSAGATIMGSLMIGGMPEMISVKSMHSMMPFLL